MQEEGLDLALGIYFLASYSSLGNTYLLDFSFVYLFICYLRQALIGHLLCSRYHNGCWVTEINETNNKPQPHGYYTQNLAFDTLTRSHTLVKCCLHLTASEFLAELELKKFLYGVVRVYSRGSYSKAERHVSLMVGFRTLEARGLGE